MENSVEYADAQVLVALLAETPVPEEEATNPNAVRSGYHLDLESAALCFSPKERFSHSLLRHFVGRTRTGKTNSQKSLRFPTSEAAHA